ncbi:MAG TPA: helix-turn-helix transcriptional regulator [Alphaproteobacteria bacterium]|jgi:phage repressor protein C with HTH and peptisase S24 domain
MYSHADIWRAIDILADKAGYSPSGLAKKAGLDPTTFNKSKRISADKKPRWPSTESIAKILSVTDMTMSDFFSLAGDENGAGGKTIPVLRIDHAARVGAFGKDGRPAGKSWDAMAFPGAALDLFALEADGECGAPFYREGDVLILSTEADARRGDRVAVKADGAIHVGELQRRTGGRIELKTPRDGGKTTEIETASIDWIARILWVSQ